MPDEQFVRRTDMQTLSALSQAESGWHCETLIENHSGQAIYAMQADGNIQEIAPLYSGVGFGQRVIIKHVRRVGLINRDPGMFSGRPTINSPKYPRTDIEIALQRLSQGPLYLREVGLALSLERDLPRLREENYLDPGFCNNRVSGIAEEYLSNGYPAPMLVIGNCHDESVEFLYVVIGGRIMSVKLRHDISSDEELRFLMNRNDSHTRWRIEKPEWSKMQVMEPVIDKEKWLIGTDLEKVHLRMRERIREQTNKLTPAEVELRIAERTEELNRKLETVLAQLENSKNELRLTKDKLANTEVELNKANDSSRASFEQHQLASKMAMQLQDQAFTIKKQEMDQLRMDAILQQARAKTESDIAIAQAKVQKETISVQGAEASNFGTVAKTVTVVAPIAAAAAAWLHKQQAASSAIAAVGGLSAVVNLPMVGVITAVALMVKPVISVVKHSINVISSKAKQFWSWLTA